ncbi:hypothetical protein VNO77_20518 [Canavalia gladiata]|uniref:Uncharacterized protein n=1 Tax=Canavalia gladiata TaxID=3824 RepID=A0AAN9LTP2_CANGL
MHGAHQRIDSGESLQCTPLDTGINDASWVAGSECPTHLKCQESILVQVMFSSNRATTKTRGDTQSRHLQYMKPMPYTRAHVVMDIGVAERGTEIVILACPDIEPQSA